MYAMSYAQVGANIQAELQKKGMTQQALADTLSVSKQVMSKIIKGAKAINVTEIAQIADALGTTAEQLLLFRQEIDTEDSYSFMGAIRDSKALEKVKLIQTAIDEIRFLEELIDD